MKEGSLNKIIRDISRKTLEEDTASHAVYPAEQGRRIRRHIVRKDHTINVAPRPVIFQIQIYRISLISEQCRVSVVQKWAVNPGAMGQGAWTLPHPPPWFPPSQTPLSGPGPYVDRRKELLQWLV